MRRAFSVYSRCLHLSSHLKLNANSKSNCKPNNITKLQTVSFLSSSLRFFSSSETDSTDQSPTPNKDSNPTPQPETKLAQSENKEVTVDVEDVNNKGNLSDRDTFGFPLILESFDIWGVSFYVSFSVVVPAWLIKSSVASFFYELKLRLEDYFKKGNEEALPSIIEAILQRKLTGKHEETDDELMHELQMQPLDDVKDQDFESDFEEAYETDEEIDDLYNARDNVIKKMASDEFFYMDDRKWDDMIKEATEHGFLKHTKECEEILEDMLSWDKLLPDDIKKKVEQKFDEIAARVEKGELEVEEGYALFKEFEDQMVMECAKLMEAEEPPQFDETAVPDKKNNLDDPPGEGPVLRWQTRVVLAPGGDAWHPKNRKVKLSVTVKELGLSKHQFRRLRELVGKRYHPGKDELTITSERFEHREENRKDCLRTLLALIEEAGKANKLVEDARTSYMKERLRSNPHFMGRLEAKIARSRESSRLPA